jgi:hypothetical protein
VPSPERKASATRLAATGRRGPRAFVALESGAPWHWGWALAHELGCDDCLIVIQQSAESHAEFALRADRAWRGLAGSRPVTVLGALHTATKQFVNARFSTPRALIAHLERGGCTGILPTATQKVLWIKTRPILPSNAVGGPAERGSKIPGSVLSGEGPLELDDPRAT